MKSKKIAGKRISGRRYRQLIKHRFFSLLKRYAWRLTAIWCWIHISSHFILKRDILLYGENYAIGHLIAKLSNVGFDPVSQVAFVRFLKIFWLLMIVRFSIIRLLFFFTYVVLFPFICLFVLKYQQIMRKARLDASFKYEKTHSSVLAPIVVSGLIGWFVLYGNSNNRLPLLCAIGLTLLLLVIRFYRALIYATVESPSADNTFKRLAAAALKYIQSNFKQLREGKYTELWQLRYSLKLSFWMLRRLRQLSRYMYGHTARKRVALFVLLKYMMDFGILGCLIVLLWAFIIRFSVAPHPVAMSDALLSSATHVLPGVPDVASIRVSPMLQAEISATAWIVLVLYAGPVASLFPVFQEKYVSRISKEYERIRIARKNLYNFVDVLRRALDLFAREPKLIPIAKLIATIRSAPDLQALYQKNPELVKTINGSPVLLDFLKMFDIDLPPIEQLPS